MTAVHEIKFPVIFRYPDFSNC